MPYAASAQQTAQQSPQNSQQNQQKQEVKINFNYGKDDKSLYAALWQRNPRIRYGQTGKDDLNFGVHLTLDPNSKHDFKLAASNQNGMDEAGLYYQFEGRKFLVGSGVEYINGKLAGEFHARFGKPRSNQIFAGYGNFGGKSAFMIGDFFNKGKYHFGILGSFKTDTLPVQFGERNQIMFYAAYQDFYKFFYRDDGRTRLLNGFVRFGNTPEKIRYSPRAFDIDRIDFAEFELRRAGVELFDIPLRPENIHLSDQGVCAFAPRFLSTPQSNSQTIHAYCTISGRWIIGYGFSRLENNSGTNSSHTFNAGANIGHVKIVGGINTERGPSVHASLRIPIKK
jgi:hypothetical protein